VSSTYRGAAGARREIRFVALRTTWGWRFATPCSNFQNLHLTAAIVSDEARRGHEAFSR
jgi:hypothetical protein